MFHVLEHVPDPIAVLKSCHSLLSPGGILVIAVPNELASLRGLVRRVRDRLGLRRNGAPRLGIPRITLDGTIDEIHLSHFTPRVLRRALESVGFSVISNTPDPCLLRTGFASVKADAYYYGCVLFQRIFRVNLFDAMFVVARKTVSGSDISLRRPAASR